LNNNKLINPKLICAFCWFVLFFNYENARSKKQNNTLFADGCVVNSFLTRGLGCLHYSSLAGPPLPHI